MKVAVKWMWRLLAIAALALIVLLVGKLDIALHSNFYLASWWDTRNPSDYVLAGVPKDTLKGFTFSYEPQEGRPPKTRVGRYLQAAGATPIASPLHGATTVTLLPDIRVYDTPATRQEIVVMSSTPGYREGIDCGAERFVTITSRQEFEQELAETIKWIPEMYNWEPKPQKKP